MGILDKIKSAVDEPGLTEELLAHMSSMGISARIVDPKGPEATTHTASLGMFGAAPLGCVKLEGRNLEFVEMYRYFQNSGGAGGRQSRGSAVYEYKYISHVKVGEREKDLKANIEYETRKTGMFKKEIAGFHWAGGQLAQDLNQDAELKEMLMQSGVPHLVVYASKKDGYVAISKDPEE